MGVEMQFQPTYEMVVFLLVVAIAVIAVLGASWRALLKTHLTKLTTEASENKEVISKNTAAVDRLTNALDVIVAKMNMVEKQLEHVNLRLDEHHDTLTVLTTQHNSLHPEGCRAAIELTKQRRKKNEKV